MYKKQTMRKIFTTAMTLVACGVFMTSCDRNNDPEPAPGPAGTNNAIVLDCDYLETDRVLTDDPDAPVDYVITCEADVYGKLTVDPGVVIAFEPGASLTINKDASFTMNGTEDKPIILTGVEKEKGIWNGMLIESINASNSMKYVTIEYAGNKSVSHSGGVSTAGLQVIKGGDVTIDHCTFQHCKNYGLFWESSNYISITNSVFTKNDIPMRADGSNQIKLFNNTNTYTGNVNDYVNLDFRISYDNKKITWRKIDVPYRIIKGGEVNIDHAQLVIEPGVDIIMSVSGAYFKIWKDASITAVGTESDPIIFRGENGVKADWDCIYMYRSASALNEIAHAKIQDAGNSMADIGAAVQLSYGAYLNLHDVDFTNNAGYAVGMVYAAAMPYPVLDHDNITVDNGKKFCKGVNGDELTDPNDPNS